MNTNPFYLCSSVFICGFVHTFGWLGCPVEFVALLLATNSTNLARIKFSTASERVKGNMN